MTSIILDGYKINIKKQFKMFLKCKIGFKEKNLDFLLLVKIHSI